MARLSNHLPSLRIVGALALLGLSLPACTDDGSSLDAGDDASTTAAETSASDPSGDPTTSTSTEPGTSDASSTAGTAGTAGTTEGPDPETGGSGEPSDTTTTGDAPTVEEQLAGHWVSEGCEPLPQADGSVLYFIRDFTLGVADWSITGTIYGDDACTYPLLTLDLGGAYEITGPSAGIDGAYEAGFDRSSIALTPHVPDFVAWFDSEGCGEDPWAVGVQQDVTAGGCAFVPSAEACPVEYDLVSLDGTDRLFFGQRPVTGDMCSPRTRPAMLGEHAVARQ